MELTRAQKRVILMIVDAALLYISGYIAYFFLSEYIETSNDNTLFHCRNLPSFRFNHTCIFNY